MTTVDVRYRIFETYSYKYIKKKYIRNHPISPSNQTCSSVALLPWYLNCSSITIKATAYSGIYPHSVPPRIIPFHFEEHIRAGSLVQVICVVGEGDSPIDIRWTLHGEEVRPKLGIFTQRVGERTSILSIDRVGSEHRGSYTCLASNHAGRTNHTETLWVNGMLSIGCHGNNAPNNTASNKTEL